MRRRLRGIANAALRPLRLRVVNTRWGPRGEWDALERARRRGVTPHQIVDAGASNGTWTRACLRIFPDAGYFLVDPLSRNCAALDALAAERANVRVWHGALGAARGRMEIRVHGDQSSFLASESFPSQERESVEVRPLDALLEEGSLGPPELIKADVQGYELQVLEGARRCLETTQLLLLEVSFRRLYQGAPLAHEVIAAAGDLGFRIYDVCSYSQRPGDGALVQSDLLFAREGSPLFESEGYF